MTSDTHAHGENKRRGAWRVWLALLALGVAGAIVAVVVFDAPPVAVAFAGMIALHPLVHLAGGHGQGHEAQGSRGTHGGQQPPSRGCH